MYQPKHKYNLKRDVVDERDHTFRVTAPEAFPPLLDKRAELPAPFDQAQEGSCTANMGVAALISYMFKKAGILLMFSRNFLYYAERTLESTVKTDSGASIRDTMKALAQTGACLESSWPYLPSNLFRKPAKKCYTEASKYRIGGYQAVAQSLIAIKTALVADLLVCIGISVYQSFESDAVAKSGLVPMPAKHEQLLGGHAVLIVGYDDSQQCFIVRNSWGTDWGGPMKGYFYLPYAYVLDSKLASDFWVISA